MPKRRRPRPIVRPLHLRFPDGETLTLKWEGSVADVLTSVPSDVSGCNHFGVVGVDKDGKWSVGWNGVFDHDQDSLEAALAYWRLRWHRRAPVLPEVVP